jgi:hypothetical protein
MTTGKDETATSLGTISGSRMISSFSCRVETGIGENPNSWALAGEPAINLSGNALPDSAHDKMELEMASATLVRDIGREIIPLVENAMPAELLAKIGRRLRLTVAARRIAKQTRKNESVAIDGNFRGHLVISQGCERWSGEPPKENLARVRRRLIFLADFLRNLPDDAFQSAKDSGEPSWEVAIDGGPDAEPIVVRARDAKDAVLKALTIQTFVALTVDEIGKGRTFVVKSIRAIPQINDDELAEIVAAHEAATLAAIENALGREDRDQ